MAPPRVRVQVRVPPAGGMGGMALGPSKRGSMNKSFSQTAAESNHATPEPSAISATKVKSARALAVIIAHHRKHASFWRWRRLFREEIGKLRMARLMGEKRTSVDTKGKRRESMARFNKVVAPRPPPPPPPPPRPPTPPPPIHVGPGPSFQPNP